METETITKHGTPEDLQKDLAECGFHEDKQRPLETVMAETRIRLDQELQKILAESGLPIYLFTYLLTDIENDMRKADMDVMRANVKED